MTTIHTKASSTDVEDRSHLRFWTRLSVTVTLSDATVKGQILDIGCGGLFITVPSPAVFSAVNKVHLTFSLPSAVEIKALAAVKWIREQHTLEGPPGCGLQFLGLGRAEMQFLEDYIGKCEKENTTRPGTSSYDRKFTVETSQHGWLVIELRGHLLATESEELRDAVAKRIESWNEPQMLVLIEASGFQPSPEESLRPMRDWLSLLGKQPSFAGVLIGRGTVGMLQLRRIARDADIAGALASFDDVASGVDFLRAAQGTVEPPTPGETREESE